MALSDYRIVSFPFFPTGNTGSKTKEYMFHSDALQAYPSVFLTSQIPSNIHVKYSLYFCKQDHYIIFHIPRKKSTNK
jgi:hypothetical protein